MLLKASKTLFSQLHFSSTLRLSFPFTRVNHAFLRNIGISAHIDSGKTTFSQRVLFYAGKIDAIHQVKGSDSVGATMDFMQLQREKGITIQSAATHLTWKDHYINLIDTPGHVDFTIEVERALRVLDGAVLLVCGVGGVQPQTMTVNRQMNRYNVPRIIFINKLDRVGANPWSAIQSLRDRLDLVCAAIQVPMGEDENLKGVIDIINERAYFFDGKSGETIREQVVPEKFKNIVKEKKNELIEQLSNVDPEMEEMFLAEQTPTPLQIENTIRRLVLERKFYPVFMGSAYKNKGVQLAIDGVLRYLPSPSQRVNLGYKTNHSTKKQEQFELQTDEKKPFVGYVFKLQENKFGQLTYIRVYQGKLKKGSHVYNDKLKKRLKVSRMVKMHANEMQEIDEVGPGDIFAIFGVECATGESLTEGDASNSVRCSSMHVPEAVMELSIKPASKTESADRFQKALAKFQREDPTFRVGVDKESEEIIISGMGELHLQIYAERIRREFGVNVKTGAPGVNFRQTITKKANFDYLHKKQTGGAGQFARVMGYVEPLSQEEGATRNQFVNEVSGTSIPPEYIGAVQKAFHDLCVKGPQTGYPVINMKYVLQDGVTHVVDSSANAFAAATKGSFLKAMQDSGQILLQPMMNVQVTVPKHCSSEAMGGLAKRKGLVTNTETKGDLFVLTADVPLREMFGYATELRGITSGEGEFAMEFKKHYPMPPEQAKIAIEKYKAKRRSE